MARMLSCGDDKHTFFKHHHRFQGGAELLHFARVNASCSYFRNDAFEVAHFAEFHLAEFAKFGLAEELFHTVEARIDVFDRT